MEGRKLLRLGIFAVTGRITFKFLVILNVFLVVFVSSASIPPAAKCNRVRTVPPIEVNALRECDTEENKQNKSLTPAICQSEDCKAISKLIQEVRDEKVDPCENFYEYACGKWIKNNKVPPGHLQFSRITQLSKNNERVMKETLVRDQPEDTETIMKVKNFYRSCLNVKKIDDLGNKPLLNYINGLGSWALNTKWSAKNWNFYDVLSEVQRDYPVEVFFSINVIQDPVKAKGTEKKKYIVLVSVTVRDKFPRFKFIEARCYNDSVSDFLLKDREVNDNPRLIYVVGFSLYGV